MKGAVIILLGALATGCSLGEAPSDLAYDPTVQAALAQAKAQGDTDAGVPVIPSIGLFDYISPTFLDDSQAPRTTPSTHLRIWKAHGICPGASSTIPGPASRTARHR